MSLDQKQLTPKRIESTYHPKAHVDPISKISMVEPTYQSKYSHKTSYQQTHGERVNCHKRDNLYKYDDLARRRDDNAKELQPQATPVSKHWYDEFPVEDRRKQLQLSIQRRKEKEFQFLNRHNQNLEKYRDRSSDNVDSKLGLRRNTQFDQNDLRDLSDKKYFSRSYNRSGNLNKRSFAQPLKSQDSAELNANPSTPKDFRNYGKSASHGL